jgi:hypothetical protein
MPVSTTGVAFARYCCLNSSGEGARTRGMATSCIEAQATTPPGSGVDGAGGRGEAGTLDGPPLVAYHGGMVRRDEAFSRVFTHL